MSAFLNEQPIAITEYDEHFVRRLIEKVTVYEDKSPWNLGLVWRWM